MHLLEFFINILLKENFTNNSNIMNGQKNMNIFSILNDKPSESIQLNFIDNFILDTTKTQKEQKLLTTKYEWYVWIRETNNSDWSLHSYIKVGSLNSINDFFEFSNSLQLFDPSNYQIFIMKQNIKPLWEDPMNRNGGACSFKLNIHNGFAFYEDVVLFALNEDLFLNSNDLNGMSFSTKNNWAIVKLWNKDCKNNVTRNLKPTFQNKYSHLYMRYKKNEPEY
jgi:hypothetical protein